jgi:predicted GIY-YIG superfamily endonuclease
MIYVYWIHEAGHSDPLTEGYIGISCDPTKRMKYHSHKKNNDNYALYKALKDGAIQTILHSCSDRESALLYESKYRPIENTGWNIIPGGKDPPSQLGKIFTSPNHGMRNKKHTEKANVQRSVAMTGLVWCNNGTLQKRVKEDNIPVGYVKGRIIGFKWRDKNKQQHWVVLESRYRHRMVCLKLCKKQLLNLIFLMVK